MSWQEIENCRGCNDRMHPEFLDAVGYCSRCRHKDRIQGKEITKEQATLGLHKLIYLASPYTDKSLGALEVQETRYQEVMRIAAALMNRGDYIYSPIIHCHPMAVKYGLPTDWHYWKNYLHVILPKCDELWVAMMDGFLQSTGVNAEITLAKKWQIPVKYLDTKSLVVYNNPDGNTSSQS